MGGYKGLKKCSVCDYTHRHISQVRRHELQAHGERAIECTVSGCGLRLPFNRLARHIREQHPNTDSPIVAATGSSAGTKQFSDLKPLNQSAISTSLPCSVCGKTVKDRNALRKHLNQVHSKKPMVREKKYCCDWPDCGKAFTAPCKLEDHRNSHTGERPYSCDHCKKDFTTKQEYSRHLKKYHQLNIRTLNKHIEQYMDHELLPLKEEANESGSSRAAST